MAATEQVQRNRANAQRPVEVAPYSKAKTAGNSPSKPIAESETAGSNESFTGGDEVILTPALACAPDSFIIQACSFEDWTYTFP